MHWVPVGSNEFKGESPSPRSGHSAVVVNGNKLVVFGGLFEKQFLNDLVVLDPAAKAWIQPACSGGTGDGSIGPGPRAFHVAIAIDCHMFIFGGRRGRQRLGDFWMLDTDTWQWAELSGYGDLPPARDFAAGAAVGNGRLVIYGGWDGTKWLSDVYVLDTISLEWAQLPITGPSPPPRCGHTVTMLEKRMLIFGGRGAGGPIMGDLWALKGLFDEEPAAWTMLRLAGSAPNPRCGHTTVAAGTQVVVFGGHGTGGWLTRYDIYYNDSTVLDRGTSVQWKRMSTNGEPPEARAYHTMTWLLGRFVLIGGYNSKTTFGDVWFLVLPDDPLARRAASAEAAGVSRQPSLVSSSSRTSSGANSLSPGRQPRESQDGAVGPMGELRRRLGLSSSVAPQPELQSTNVSAVDDTDLVQLGARLLVDTGAWPSPDGPSLTPSAAAEAVRAGRAYLRDASAQTLRLSQLFPLLSDYRRLVAAAAAAAAAAASHSQDGRKSSADQGPLRAGHLSGLHRFYHLRSAREVRLHDIPSLLDEYRSLLLYHFSPTLSLP